MHGVDLHKVRYISVVGDAELDEGSVWEAIAEPAMSDLSHVLWVVDLNRQSLDRVIPGIRVRAWRDMFAANGWNVVDAKYGSRLQAAFEEPNGELLRVCIDEMPNELYQRLLRLSPRALREWLPQSSRYPKDMSRFLGAGATASCASCSTTWAATTSQRCATPFPRPTWTAAPTLCSPIHSRVGGYPRWATRRITPSRFRTCRWSSCARSWASTSRRSGKGWSLTALEAGCAPTRRGAWRPRSAGAQPRPWRPFRPISSGPTAATSPHSRFSG